MLHTIFWASLSMGFILPRPRSCAGQQISDSQAYNQTISKETLELSEKLKNNDPDLQGYFYPERRFLGSDYYIEAAPDIEDYKIGLLVDPCRSNSPDCCANVYGTAEYGRLAKPDLTYPYRVTPKYLLGSENEISQNMVMVNEFGEILPTSAVRRADDISQVNEACIGPGDPYSYCVGYRQSMSPFPQRPACMDNNSTVDATLPCWNLVNKTTALSVICGNEFADDPHCGTFLEIHLPSGSPDYENDYKIQERQIDQRNTSGYLTTTISLTYLNDDPFIAEGRTRILCAYEETSIRVGSTVLVRDSAPVCCCPANYYFCPYLGSTRGPYAQTVDTILEAMQMDTTWYGEPFCPPTPPAEDWIMCQNYSKPYNRNVYYKCPAVNTSTSGHVRSRHIRGNIYTQSCPYFSSCALAVSNASAAAICAVTEGQQTFIGQVGIVVSVPYYPDATDDGSRPYYVTFNGGRSLYPFLKEDLVLDDPDYNYELWWVQRTRYNYIVQKKKPFKVAAPRCTYDTSRQQYLPYAILENDNPVRTLQR